MIEVDYIGGEDYDLQGVVFDINYLSGLYFGMVCCYISIWNMVFFFDDVLVDFIVEDEEVLIVQSVVFEISNSIIV